MKIKLLFLIFFSVLTAQAQMTVSIVGSAVGGWPGDGGNPGPIDIHQMTTTDGENWIIEHLVVTTGEVKFRANNDWTMNWGSASFPIGTGIQEGTNIVCTAGTYAVFFNSTTGEYSFAADDGSMLPIVNLIGTAIANPQGISFSTLDGENYTATAVTLLDGTAQFNINTINYGSTTFPNGILTANSSALLIPVTAGNYSSISINFTSGEYHFVAAPVYSAISICGTAVGDLDVDMATTDGITYNYIALGTVAGELKFRANNSSAINYGGLDFPTGTTVLNGAAIPVPYGNWDVTFNLITGVYHFTDLGTATGISIVGSSFGGWPGAPTNPGPIDIHQLTTTDGIIYTAYNLAATDGEAKFRQNNDWTTNWGSASFPTGTGLQEGTNILVAAGNYTITFNRVNGKYNFAPPNRIAIVGSAAGGWPTETIGEIDAHQLESTDGLVFNLEAITLTDGYVKFRQNNSWAVSWGGTSLSAPLVLNGPDIPVTAGTYSVTMNRLTGSYTLEPLGLSKFNSADFKVYPNPTQNNWTFASAKESIQTIQIVDVLGKTVRMVNPKSSTAYVDASDLKAGIYFAKIITLTADQTVKVIKN